MENTTAMIRDVAHENKIPSFKCPQPDNQHNNVFWNNKDDAANGGHSPINDALYSDMMARAMYKQWFNLPILAKNGKPMQVKFYVHDPKEGSNASYDRGIIRLGDGDEESYPLAAPSVIAHELSHGFTEQNSGLVYEHMSGGIDESFSDMADKSVEYYIEGKNNWDIDPELLKEGGRMLRYMDEPTKDCEGREPGKNCSIDNARDYYPKIDPHFSSGVFNKAFYLLATKWDTRRAFAVMVHANKYYWTPNVTFANAACGVIKAARDYKYDHQVVRTVMETVGIKTDKC